MHDFIRRNGDVLISINGVWLATLRNTTDSGWVVYEKSPNVVLNQDDIECIHEKLRELNE
jgi:hypothetical protein